ncbi:CbiX/SirB N-terminal domain-containing protein [Ectothiorhodospiraceae bacterium WFHF3C12]|nr:CbiX/SirB N-terminal domain-containing protein [Ectothiorhodospiraceae bacterium WFHF3C12]
MNPHTHLVVIAHGSRREASNEEVAAFAERLGQAMGPGGSYEAVGCAFLELAEPSIPDAMNHAVAAGARQVDLFPYFLAAGRHVAEDIPRIVGEARGRHPHVGFRILEHFGAWDELPDMIARGLDAG